MNLEQIPAPSHKKTGPETKKTEEKENELSRTLWAMQIEQAKKDLFLIEKDIEKDSTNEKLIIEKNTQLEKIEDLAKKLEEPKKQKLEEIDLEIKKLEEEKDKMANLFLEGTLLRDTKTIEETSKKLDILKKNKKELELNLSRLHNPLNTEERMALK